MNMTARLTCRKVPDRPDTSAISATVYLLPNQMAQIKQICAEGNHRISDLLGEAVEQYLRSHAFA
jgi:hypothetical protein